MDNFIVVHHDKNHLRQIKEEIRGLLVNRLRLELNPKNSLIGKASDGIEFVGYRVFAGRVKVKRASLQRMKKRATVMQAMYRAGRIALNDITQRVRSWLGHVKHAQARTVAGKLLNEAVFTRG